MSDRRKQGKPFNKQLFLLFTALISLLLANCSPETRSREALYDIDSLIRTQIRYLKEYNTSIQKTALLNGVQNVTTIKPTDSADWDEELAIFMELDVMNKPSNKALYKIDSELDSKNNLNVKSFTATEDLPVVFLKVYYNRSLDELRKVEARYYESNALYKSTRYLTMEFEQVYNTTLLTSYKVAGGQKMFLDDSVQYSISASIDVKQN